MKSLIDPAYAVMLGPMEGVFCAPILQGAASLRLVPVFVSAFIRVSETPVNGKNLQKFLTPYRNLNAPVIIQLLGDHPAKLTESARNLAELGYNQINLNFGCPSRQVLSSHGGGDLLRRPEQMRRIVNTLKTALPQVRLSAKIRCGFADFAELPTILAALNADDALEFLAIHTRTVLEQYLPIAPEVMQRRRCQAVANSPKIPVILNGDIDTVELADRVRQEANPAGVMCARGFFRDPYLLRRLADPSGVYPAAEMARERYCRAVFAAAGALNIGLALELVLLCFGGGHRYAAKLKALHAAGRKLVTEADLAL